MAGNKRGSGCVRVRESTGTARSDRTPDRVPLTCAEVSRTDRPTERLRRRTRLFRFEPYVNLSAGGCPEE